MEISPGIEIVDTALWIKKEQILVLSDLHIGYEESLHKKGILTPKYQTSEILKKLESICNKHKPKIIILNGDLKHEFGSILRQEWKDIASIIELCHQFAQVIIVKGNHDPIIAPIANKAGVNVLSEYRVGDVNIVHGDVIVPTDAKKIIIGHEHPAITLAKQGKIEKYKCFLKGPYKDKEIIIIPSFNPLLEGTNVLAETFLSPYLTDIKKFQVFVVNGEEALYFGKVKDLISDK